MGILKDNGIKQLTSGFVKFENSKDSVKNSDYSDIKTFIADFLNTSDKKQRKKLAEEFKKRHLELYQFLKENSELVNAETEISKIVTNVAEGMLAETENHELNNLFRTIEESEKL